MPIIAIATSKGGSGKTTLAACLADYWAKKSLRVECLDTDPNRNLHDWLRTGNGGTICTAVEEEALLDAAERAAETADRVVIDVAGSLAKGLLYAVSVAQVVIIPCRCDRKDVVEACRTQELIHSAGKMVRRTISHAAVLTQVNRRAEVTTHTRQQLEIMEVPVLAADLPGRTAYQQASYTGSPLTNPDVRKDIAAIAAEIDLLIERAS